MKIGIDISQLAYQNTGVANYLQNLVLAMINQDQQNEYVLFFSSLRGKLPTSFTNDLPSNVTLRTFKLPPSALDFLWNKLHVVPIERFIGSVDIFVSSDWCQPPVSQARSVTIVYDLIVYKYPEETHNQISFKLPNFQLKSNIVQTQKRRLSWVKKECDAVLCISESTKKDVLNILEIPENKIYVLYPGVTK